MGKRKKGVKVTDIRGNKPWLKKVGLSISEEPTIPSNTTFLIVCEGQTEEQYFKYFNSPATTVKAIGLGCSNSALIDCTIGLMEGEDYDEIWSVYDLDYSPDKGPNQNAGFDNSIEKAKAHGIEVAYSNDVFELWFLLHYENWSQPELRHYIYKRLSDLWNVNYMKEGKTLAFSRTIPIRLNTEESASMKNAIARAKALHMASKELPYHQQNPVTLVYLLVQKLIKK